MCDDFTHDEDAAWLKARAPLTRRELGLAGGAIAATAMAGCTTVPAAPGSIRERAVAIPMAGGRTADAFFVHPASGKHPAILLWPDIAGLREAFREASRRLAAQGFAVVAVNHYYRSSPSPVLPEGVTWGTPEGRAIVQPMGALLTPDAYAADSRDYIAWLDAQPEVDTGRRVGSVGHCMTGQSTVRAAAAVPSRVGAAVSFHGGGLATDKPDSPHRLIASTRASFLFAIAQNDDEKEPMVKDMLRAAAAKAGRPAEVEVYPARHGWTTLDSQVYDPVQAERAWGRARALFNAL